MTVIFNNEYAPLTRIAASIKCGMPLKSFSQTFGVKVDHAACTLAGKDLLTADSSFIHDACRFMMGMKSRLCTDHQIYYTSCSDFHSLATLDLCQGVSSS